MNNVKVQSLFSLLAAAVVSLSMVGNATASAEWHWDRSGIAPYTGQIVLRDGASYSRHSGATAPLFGATSIISPLAVVAGGAAMDIGLYHAGKEVDKTTTCSGGTEWKVYLAITSMCQNGAYNIGGVRTWAEENGDKWTPQMSIFSPGWGWMRVTDELDCAIVEAKQVCQTP